MSDAHPSAAAVTITVLVAALLLASSVAALIAWRTIYASETKPLVDSAAAQDLVSVVTAIVLLLVLAFTVRTGSALAALVWAGLLAFVAYNVAIYCFSVHFGPLFLVWTALLGLSTYGAFVVAAAVDHRVLSPFLHRISGRVLAWVLIVAAAVFGLLWLKEIIPDLLAGRGSTSAAYWRVPTNPVHVLDLAVFLPATMAGGVLILRGDPRGVQVGVPMLVWLILTCLPILLTPIMAPARGHTPDWAATPPVATLLVVFLLTGALLLHDASQGGTGPGGSSTGSTLPQESTHAGPPS